MNELPPYAEPLSIPGFYAHWEAGDMYGTQRSLRFFVLQKGTTSDGMYARIGQYNVADIVFPQIPSWRVPRPEELRYEIRTYSQTMRPAVVRATAEVLQLAADVCDTLATQVQHLVQAAEEKAAAERRAYEERQRERERERQQRIAEQQAQRAMERLRETHLFELMKWHLGDRIKCRRDGFKQSSHPQGTIDQVDERGMNITTEKGKFMRIEFKLVNCMWLKDVDSPRSYDVIYQAGDEVKEEVTSNDDNG